MKPRELTVEFMKSRCQCDGDDGCWTWKEAHVNGQPRMTYKGKASLAHRVMWELVKGKPPQHELYATCGFRGCMNPAHRVDIPKAEIPVWQSIARRASVRALQGALA